MNSNAPQNHHTMSEIDHDTRVLIASDRFVDGATFPAIAQKRNLASASTARSICAKASKRAKSNNIDDILPHIDPAPREGAPRRVEPGSRASQVIRDAMRGPYRFLSQEVAANKALQSVMNVGDRKPFKPLAAPQVQNIARGRAHCEADRKDSRPIPRERNRNREGERERKKRERERKKREREKREREKREGERERENEGEGE
jgi:hypothetical protein